MDIFRVTRVLNDSVIGVIDSLVPLREVDSKKNLFYTRLKETEYKVSNTTQAIVSEVVNAHDLADYKNIIYTIQLEEKCDTWLDKLVRRDDGNT